jgi:Mg2+ and Co2+ transporter CorA
MKSLFSINEDILTTFDLIEQFCQENNTDEVPEHLAEQLSISEDQMSEKIENYFFVIKELKGQVETIKEHVKQMTQKKKAIENRIDSLKTYVGHSVQMFGETNKSGNKFFKSDLFKVTASRSSRLVITDSESVPEEFKRQVYSEKIDNAGIKKAIQNGQNVDGAMIDDSKINVTFR